MTFRRRLPARSVVCELFRDVERANRGAVDTLSCRGLRLASSPLIPSQFAEQTEDSDANPERRERGEDNEEDYAHCAHFFPLRSSSRKSAMRQANPYTVTTVTMPTRIVMPI